MRQLKNLTISLEMDIVDIELVKKPELRILLRLFNCLFLQSLFPKELEADFAAISDPQLFQKMASLVWAFSQTDDWPKWQKFLQAKAKTLKLENLDFLKL